MKTNMLFFLCSSRHTQYFVCDKYTNVAQAVAIRLDKRGANNFCDSLHKMRRCENGCCLEIQFNCWWMPLANTYTAYTLYTMLRAQTHILHIVMNFATRAWRDPRDHGTYYCIAILVLLLIMKICWKKNTLYSIAFGRRLALVYACTAT